MVILTGCGRSIEKDLIGVWKIDMEETTSYMEFSDERLIVREDLDAAPETANYRLTDLQKGKFIIEIAEPGTNTYIFFLEAKFEKKDKINITKALDAGDKTFDLFKVKNPDIEIKKERRKQEALAAKEENKKAEKEKVEKIEKERAEAEKAQKEENDAIKDDKNDASQEQVGKAKEKKISNEITQDNSLKAQYLREADHLHEEIINYAMELYPSAQDMRPGFYGQYYTEWDDLLNEIWRILKDSMPANEFEHLKANQNKWIKQKEQGFSEYPDEPASSRGMGMDYLAFETKDRVYYFIDSYLK